MHKLYIEECLLNKLPEKFCNLRASYYRHVTHFFYTFVTHFVTNFNLSFGEPRSDTCSTCDPGKGDEEHTDNYHAAFEAIISNRNLAQSYSKVAHIIVDLQQTMPLPCLSKSKVFYLH